MPEAAAPSLVLRLIGYHQPTKDDERPTKSEAGPNGARSRQVAMPCERPLN